MRLFPRICLLLITFSIDALAAEPADLPPQNKTGAPLPLLDVDWEHPFFQTRFETAAVLSDWSMEGPGTASIREGKLILETDAAPEGIPLEKNPHHIVYWLKRELPADFLIEFLVNPRNRQQGLNIVFFNARGLNGESIFDPALAARDGTFKQYHSGDLNNYHVSYWAGDRGTAHIRKNKGAYLVAQGNDLVNGAPQGVPQQVRIYKRGGQIRVTVDGRPSVAFDDDGVQYGPVIENSGWMGLRQMGWTRHCEYDDLTVYPLLPTAAEVK
ncbi:DUF1961 family protein [Planctomicrobium sp. SH664]|uniref:DUF1961 family protein n=1 Tax=Planctomicrobium sp. SH664 TaxID=3448125 RepID=UPI003F5AF41A